MSWKLKNRIYISNRGTVWDDFTWIHKEKINEKEKKTQLQKRKQYTDVMSGGEKNKCPKIKNRLVIQCDTSMSINIYIQYEKREV